MKLYPYLDIQSSHLTNIFVFEMMDRSICFVGIQPKEIQSILDKHQSQKELTTSEMKQLEEHFGKTLKKVLGDKKRMYYMKNYILLDDTVQKVKEKINNAFHKLFNRTVDLSSIYIVSKSGNSVGHYFIDNDEDMEEEKEILFETDPSKIMTKVISEKELMNIHSKYFITNTGASNVNLKKMPRTYMTLNDIDNQSFTYKVFIIDEMISYLRKCQIAFTSKIFKGFLEAYYPNLNYEMVKQRMEQGRQEYPVKNFDIETDLINELNNQELEKNRGKINSFQISLQNKNIQLNEIFENITTTEKIPYVKYRNSLGDMFYQILPSFVTKENIAMIRKWSDNKPKLNRLYGVMSDATTKNTIIMKYCLNREMKDYLTIIINDKGRLIIKNNWNRDENAITFNKLSEIIEEINTYIRKLNNEFYLSLNQINPLVLYNSFDKNEEGQKLVYMNVFFEKKYSDILRTSFYETLKRYSSIVRINEDKKHLVSLTFKKISNYDDVSSIEAYITRQVLQYGFDRTSIITNSRLKLLLREEFDLSDSKINMELEKWSRKYGVVKRIYSNISNGINVHIDLLSKENDTYIYKVMYSGFTHLSELQRAISYVEAIMKYYFVNNRDKKSGMIETGKKIDEKWIKSDEEEKIDLEEIIGGIDLDNLDIDLDDLDDYEYEDLGFDIEDMKNNIKQEIKVLDIKQNNEEDKELSKKESSYILRKLKRSDPEVFAPSKSDKTNKYDYSKLCQSNKDRQPIVMEKGKFQQMSEKFKEDEYLKYRDHYYVCPKIWCMKDEIPLTEEELKNVKKNKDGEIISGNCPKCGDDIYNPKTKSGSVIYAKDTDGRHGYPGFLKEHNPNGLCMPCCFKKAKSRVEECLNNKKKKVEEDEDISSSGLEKYILRKDFYPLGEYRFGALPDGLAKLFNIDTTKEYSMIDKGFASYLRVGMGENFTNIMKIYGPGIEECLKLLTLETFLELNNGELYQIFFKNNVYDTFENYKNYIKNTTNIYLPYIMEFLQIPGILFDNGCNIFILEEDDNQNKFRIYNASININLPVIIIFKKQINDKSIYEPIFYVMEKNGSVKYIRMFDIVRNTFFLNIAKVLHNNKVKNDILTAQEVIKIFDSFNSKDYIIETQYISNNQVLFVECKNKLLIPVKPSAKLKNIKVQNKFEHLPLLNSIINSLKYLTNQYLLLGYEPEAIIESSNKLVTAIQLKNKLIIPVYPEKKETIITNYPFIKKNYYFLKLSLYQDIFEINNLIQKEDNQSLYIDEYQKFIQDKKRIEMGFQLLKYRLAGYLNEKKEVLKNIKELIINKNIEEIKLLLESFVKSFLKNNPIYGNVEMYKYYLSFIVSDLLTNPIESQEILTKSYRQKITKNLRKERIINENNLDKYLKYYLDDTYQYIDSSIELNKTNKLIDNLEKIKDENKKLNISKLPLRKSEYVYKELTSYLREYLSNTQIIENYYIDVLNNTLQMNIKEKLSEQVKSDWKKFIQRYSGYGKINKVPRFTKKEELIEYMMSDQYHLIPSDIQYLNEKLKDIQIILLRTRKFKTDDHIMEPKLIVRKNASKYILIQYTTKLEYQVLSKRNRILINYSELPKILQDFTK
jgi:hypothetical protein